MSLAWRDRLILLSPIGIMVVLALSRTLDARGLTLCPIAFATGVPCPGCGMTRTASNLARGDIGTAIAFHPLAPPFAVLAVMGWVWLLMRKTGRAQPLSSRVLNAILIAILTALIAVWIFRLVTGTLPPVSSIF